MGVKATTVEAMGVKATRVKVAGAETLEREGTKTGEGEMEDVA
jgi:hypothetical protein